MTTLVIGTPDCGKSQLAEQLAMQTGDAGRYYLATMQICDQSSAERVKKHRAQREGKGFVTVEKEYNIREVVELLDHPSGATVLLECVSNLVGNEMHVNPLRDKPSADALSACERFADEIVSDIIDLSGHVHHLIIVTNTYSDDEEYDDGTRLYVRLQNMVNDRLLAFADRTVDLRRKDEKH